MLHCSRKAAVARPAFARFFAAGACLTLTALALAERPAYPPTKQDNVTETLHGVQVADPYRWLENAEEATVQTWTQAQNAFTRKALDAFPDVRQALTARLEQLHAANIGSTPAIAGERYFFTKREGLENQPKVFVREGGPDAKPRLVLDPNTFSADGTVALDWWFPSPDGSLIAFGRSAGGSEKSTLYLRDVKTASDVALEIPHTRAGAVAWDADGQGFLYTRYATPGEVAKGDENYFRHVYYHKFGTEWKSDPKLYGDGRPKQEWPNVNNSSDDQYQFLYASLDWSKNDLYLRKQGEKDFRLIVKDADGRTSGDTFKDKLFLLTSVGAPRYRICVTSTAQPGQEHWKELIPQQAAVIQSMAIIDGKLVLHLLDNAYSRVVIYDSDGKQLDELKLPTLGSVGGLSGHHERPDLFYSFQSFAYPPTVFRYNLQTKETTVYDKMELPVDLSQFETKQVMVKSKDGTSVPMFVTHRKGLTLDGNNPTMLYGYGGFNISMTPSFAKNTLPFLERGGVYAVGCIRGGGEFGKEWHTAARLEQKQNCFDDFIACAERLVSDKYTTPARLAARGGSNGGLLMGAMMTQRPDLFRAIECAVPLLDMVRYTRFSIAQLWMPEYGNPEKSSDFAWIYAYSPYHRVKAGTKYPAIFFTTADSDSRVDPMHARKMAALMQSATASDHPILLWVEGKAGHGAGKPLRKTIDQAVDSLTFFMWQLGMLPKNM